MIIDGREKRGPLLSWSVASDVMESDFNERRRTFDYWITLLTKAFGKTYTYPVDSLKS